VNGPAPGNRTEIPFREPPRTVRFLKKLEKVFMSKRELHVARTVRPGRSANGRRGPGFDTLDGGLGGNMLLRD
jgi:hypothetical protein